MDLLEALTQEGVHVRAEPDWATRNTTRPFTPVGVMVHHTAGTGDGGYRIIRDGRPGTATQPRLPGPLANLHPRKDGSVHLLTAGSANHAGRGDAAVLELTNRGEAPRSAPGKDAIVGNQFYFGIEIENLGTGRDPFPDEQVDAVVRCATAICRMKNWSADRVIGHKEWTRRKGGDPALDMGWLRSAVASRLAEEPTASPVLRTRGPAPASPRQDGGPTQVAPDLIDQAAGLGLFGGDPEYYYPDGPATAAEREHFVNVVVQAAVDRLEP